MKSLKELVRPNILALAPHSIAREENAGYAAHVFLDANENPYNKPYNRYPDPLQRELKEAIAKVKKRRKQTNISGEWLRRSHRLMLSYFLSTRY